jgi:hypothetical protein
LEIHKPSTITISYDPPSSSFGEGSTGDFITAVSLLVWRILITALVFAALGLAVYNYTQSKTNDTISPQIKGDSTTEINAQSTTNMATKTSITMSADTSRSSGTRPGSSTSTGLTQSGLSRHAKTTYNFPSTSDAFDERRALPTASSTRVSNLKDFKSSGTQINKARTSATPEALHVFDKAWDSAESTTAPTFISHSLAIRNREYPQATALRESTATPTSVSNEKTSPGIPPTVNAKSNRKRSEATPDVLQYSSGSPVVRTQGHYYFVVLTSLLLFMDIGASALFMTGPASVLATITGDIVTSTDKCAQIDARRARVYK